MTDDADLAARVRKLRNHGRVMDGRWLDQDGVGFNARLSELAAALGASQEENATLRKELERDRHRLAAVMNDAGRLEHRNRALTRELARTRGRLARSENLNKSLHRQRDRDLRHIRALTADAQSLRGNLARAQAEIRRLHGAQSVGPADPQRVADRRQRDAATARELDELRRYNGYLLQERGNLQACDMEIGQIEMDVQKGDGVVTLMVGWGGGMFAAGDKSVRWIIKPDRELERDAQRLAGGANEQQRLEVDPPAAGRDEDVPRLLLN